MKNLAVIFPMLLLQPMFLFSQQAEQTQPSSSDASAIEKTVASSASLSLRYRGEAVWLPASLDFNPKIRWEKKNTLYFEDRVNGGYRSYIIIDSWMTPGPHYGSFFEIAPNCPRAYDTNLSYGAGDVASALLTGLLRDVLDLTTTYKIGKHANVTIFR